MIWTRFMFRARNVRVLNKNNCGISFVSEKTNWQSEMVINMKSNDLCFVFELEEDTVVNVTEYKANNKYEDSKRSYYRKACGYWKMTTLSNISSYAESRKSHTLQ